MNPEMAEPVNDLTTLFYEADDAKNNSNVNDLHAYFMNQFNLELDSKKKYKCNKVADNFKFGNEESFDFEVLESFSSNDSKISSGFEIIDAVIENKNVSEENIKDVLLDLDSIEFENKSSVENFSHDTKVIERTFYKSSNDYIDDESLIDELCREESDCRLTPDIFTETKNSNITNDNHILPSMETAFSKKYYNYKHEEYNLDETKNLKNLQNDVPQSTVFQSLDCYSYPNNILCNLDNENHYVLPDTPTSCSEFNFYNRNERKVSVSESIESETQSSNYYDENTEAFDEDELFVNLDDFGLNFEDDISINVEESRPIGFRERNTEKFKDQKICLWEHCYEKYPSQSTLVEHIERSHVNTYKGDEFSCLWRDCARARRPFNARYKLLIHMRVHSGHKPNQCHHPGCGKAFSRLENLKIHVRSHTGERPYACPAPQCRKAFSNSSDRAKHQRTHFNARPYACGAIGCGKRYTDPSSLRKHVKSHPHIANVPRTCSPPSRPVRRAGHEQLVPSSPAKLATMRCIRDKLTVPRLQRL